MEDTSMTIYIEYIWWMQNGPPGLIVNGGIWSYLYYRTKNILTLFLTKLWKLWPPRKFEMSFLKKFLLRLKWVFKRYVLLYHKTIFKSPLLRCKYYGKSVKPFSQYQELCFAKMLLYHCCYTKWSYIYIGTVSVLILIAWYLLQCTLGT